jgi:hypothetical protein
VSAPGSSWWRAMGGGAYTGCRVCAVMGVACVRWHRAVRVGRCMREGVDAGPEAFWASGVAAWWVYACGEGLSGRFFATRRAPALRGFCPLVQLDWTEPGAWCPSGFALVDVGLSQKHESMVLCVACSDVALGRWLPLALEDNVELETLVSSFGSSGGRPRDHGGLVELNFFSSKIFIYIKNAKVVNKHGCA